LKFSLFHEAAQASICPDNLPSFALMLGTGVDALVWGSVALVERPD
jgi:hypothetical protein